MAAPPSMPMFDLRTAPHTDPTSLYRTRDGIYAADMLLTAIVHAARNGPLHAAEYLVVLMHSSEGRCYSTTEMEEYLAGAGVRDVTHRDTAAGRGVMSARK